MDMESIRIFLDVQRAGSITAAASDHYMTQPALGKRISLLEKELGVTLFKRGKGQARVELTPAGRAFCDIARRMVLLYDQALELKQDADRQSLTVASIRSAHDYFLPQLILKLKENHPKLTISVEEHHTAEIIALLEQRRVDAGIIQTAAASPRLRSRLLYSESYQVVMRKDHPLARSETVALRDLKAAHSIFQVFDLHYEQWYSRNWPLTSAKVRVNTTPTAVQYFSEREDWMIVPDAVAHVLEEQGFAARTLEADPPKHHVYLCFHPENQRQALLWLQEAIALPPSQTD